MKISSKRKEELGYSIFCTSILFLAGMGFPLFRSQLILENINALVIFIAQIYCGFKFRMLDIKLYWLMLVTCYGVLIGLLVSWGVTSTSGDFTARQIALHFLIFVGAALIGYYLGHIREKYRDRNIKK